MATDLATPSNTLAKVRWREQYVSDGLNKKFNGIAPHGVIRGGRIGLNASPLTITVEADEETNDSIYSSINANGQQVTFRQASDISLDLTAVAGTLVYIGLKVTYTTSADTVVKWRAYSQAEVDADPTIVVLGSVDVPGGGSVLETDIDYDRRRDGGWEMSSGMREWRQVIANPSFEGRAVTIDTFPDEERDFPFWELRSLGAAGHWRVLTPGSGPASNPHTGDNNLIMDGQGAGSHQMLAEPLVDSRVVPGQVVRVSVWVRGDSVTMGDGAAAQAGINLVWYDWDGNVLGTTSFYEDGTVITGTFDWFEISGTVKAPANAASVRPRLSVNDTTSITGDIGFDDFHLWVEPGRVKLPYDRHLDIIGPELVTPGIIVAPTAGQMASLGGLDPSAIDQRSLRLLCADANGGSLEHKWGMVSDSITSWLMSLSKGRLTLGPDLIASATKSIQALARLIVSLPNSSLTANAKYILLFEGDGSGVSRGSIRGYLATDSYFGSGPALVITTNAEFLPNTDQWQRDLAGTSSSMYVFTWDRYYRYIHESGSASPWAIAGWDHTAQNEYWSNSSDGLYQYLKNARILMTDTTTFTNPAYATATTANALYAKNIVKAWGWCLTNGAGGFTTREGFGATMSLSGVGRIAVTFDDPMAVGEYAIAGLMNPNVVPPHVDWESGLSWWNQAQAGFDLVGVDRPTGTWINFDTATWQVAWMVIGEQTT